MRSLKNISCRGANCVAIGDSAGCRYNDNLRCHQWRQSWLTDNSYCRGFWSRTLQMQILGDLDTNRFHIMTLSNTS